MTQDTCIYQRCRLPRRANRFASLTRSLKGIPFPTVDAANSGKTRPNHVAKTSKFLQPEQLVPEGCLEVGLCSSGLCRRAMAQPKWDIERVEQYATQRLMTDWKDISLSRLNNY